MKNWWHLGILSATACALVLSWSACADDPEDSATTRKAPSKDAASAPEIKAAAPESAAPETSGTQVAKAAETPAVPVAAAENGAETKPAAEETAEETKPAAKSRRLDSDEEEEYSAGDTGATEEPKTPPQMPFLARLGAKPEELGLPEGQRTTIANILPSVASLLGSPHYTIHDDVRTFGPYYVFTVECPHGTYEPVGLFNLYKVCREIDAMEEYRAHGGAEFMRGMGESVAGTFIGAANLFIHPGRSIAAIARAPGRKLRGAASVIDVGPKSRTAGSKIPLASTGMRNAANELGLDIYSDNVNVQELLARIAMQRKAGSLMVSAAKMASGAAIAQGVKTAMTISKNALTPGAIDAECEQLIAENGAAELRRILKIRYDKMLDNETLEPLTQDLLNCPCYSPREQTYMHMALVRMHDLPGFEQAVRQLSQVDTPEAAIYASTQVMLVDAAMRKGDHKPTALLCLQRQIGFMDESQRAVFVLPYDTPGLGDGYLAEVGLMIMQAGEMGARQFALFTAGCAPEATAAAIRDRGVELHENLLQEAQTVLPEAPKIREIKWDDDTEDTES